VGQGMLLAADESIGVGPGRPSIAARGCASSKQSPHTLRQAPGLSIAHVCTRMVRAAPHHSEHTVSMHPQSPDTYGKHHDGDHAIE
jgi:hypothetical protein